jgi:hypothetical protein
VSKKLHLFDSERGHNWTLRTYQHPRLGALNVVTQDDSTNVLRLGKLNVIPKGIQEGVAKLLAANPSIRETEAEVNALFPDSEPIWAEDQYLEAVEGFPTPVAEQVLEWFVLHNPRSPMAPTPQDVFEMCGFLQATGRCCWWGPDRPFGYADETGH